MCSTTYVVHMVLMSNLSCTLGKHFSSRVTAPIFLHGWYTPGSLWLASILFLSESLGPTLAPPTCSPQSQGLCAPHGLRVYFGTCCHSPECLGTSSALLVEPSQVLEVKLKILTWMNFSPAFLLCPSGAQGFLYAKQTPYLTYVHSPCIEIRSQETENCCKIQPFLYLALGKHVYVCGCVGGSGCV